MNSTAYIMVGLPASGKSTYSQTAYVDLPRLSSDDIITDIAEKYGYTYNEAFSDLIKFADRAFFDEFNDLCEWGDSMIIDRTNLTAKVRKRFIDPLKKNGYKIIAVVFPTPEEEEWNRRLDSREGKSIPKEVLRSMMSKFEMPRIEEGFDDVIVMEE